MAAPDQKTNVYVIHPILKSNRGDFIRDPESSLAEACGLAAAIDLNIAGQEVALLSKISPATYIGKGLAENLKNFMSNNDVKLLFVNTSLSPGQQRNLENVTKVKVIDRTGMILEIFGARARTHEGRLQVELAALTFQRSRLVRSWTHLERQRGGGGFLGGPGEKQLELDRRMLEAKIEKIKRDLAEVLRTRRLQRHSRTRNALPTIALVGYTNAGKSTLFNALTAAEVLAKDMLFATLDPTIRPLKLPSGRKILLSDTVGFISDLPTQLIAAFRATLEEVEQADILLHVRDISHAETEAQKTDVESVMNELHKLEPLWRSRMIEVWNKCDLLTPQQQLGLPAPTHNTDDVPIISISAVTGQGLSELLSAIELKLAVATQIYIVSLPSSAGDAIAWFYRHAQVLSRTDADGASRMHISIANGIINKFQREFDGLDFQISAE